MTGIEMSSILLYIVYTGAVFIVGLFLGALCMSAYLSRKMREISDTIARQLLAPPSASEGDEWKRLQNRDTIDKLNEDEKWLRRRLDRDKDDNKDKGK